MNRKGFLFRCCEKIGNKAYYACVLNCTLLCLEMCLDLCGTFGNVVVVLKYFSAYQVGLIVVTYFQFLSRRNKQVDSP